MPALKVRIGCVVLAVVMSAVTYYIVEPRLRWGRYGGYKAAGLLSVMVVVGVAGYSIERHDGYTVRMNDPEQPVINAINKKLEEDNQRCLKIFPNWNKFAWGHDVLKCKMQRDPGENTIAVIGDSHAGHLYPGLVGDGGRGVALFSTACAIPLIGLLSSAEYKHTERLLSQGFDYVVRHKNIRKVVLSHWSACSWHKVVDTRNPSNHNFDSILYDGFTRTYKILTQAGKDIFIVSDTPSYTNTDWAKCKSLTVRRPVSIPMFLSPMNSNVCLVEQSKLPGRESRDNWNKVAREVAVGYKNVHFIDLEKAFCSEGKCSLVGTNGKLFSDDGGHLNISGSLHAAPSILHQLSD